MRRLDEFYTSLERRVVAQLEIRLERAKRVKRIFSAVHGYVEFKPEELPIVESFFLQRLRNISHLGLAYLVYPESRHSRFDHSIGAFHLAKEIIKYLEEKGSLSPEIKVNIPLAALLHDCGHFPFSHVTERALFLNHKLRGANIILGRDEAINYIWKKYRGERTYKLLYEYLQGMGFSPELIARWIAPDDVKLENVLKGEKLRRIKPYENFTLIYGALDVDKLDYLTRDSFFTGTPYGFTDLKRIMIALRIIEKEDRVLLGVEEKALASLIHFLLGNEMSYDVTACHHTTRIAESMLATALLLITKKLDGKDLKRFMLYQGLMNDSDLLQALELFSKEGGYETIGEIVKRIQFRRLFKSIQIKSTDMGVAEAMRDLCNSISGVLETPYEVPERLTLYLTKDCIQGTEEWPFKGDLIIFDLKDMPALADKYVEYAWDKLEGRKRTRPLYVIKDEEIRPLTEISIRDINPQDLLSRYIQLEASILCIGIEEDRDEKRLDKFREEKYSYLCSFLNSASKEMGRVMGKIGKLTELHI